MLRIARRAIATNGLRQLSTSRYIVLSDDEIKSELDLLKDWKLSIDSKSISKSFTFKGFQTAWAFLTQVAMHSHLNGHHPMILNKYNKVELTLHTDDVDALTPMDMKLAKRFDGYSKKLLE